MKDDDYEAELVIGTKRKKGDTKDEDVEMELEAVQEMHSYEREIKSYLQEKCTKGHKVSKEVISWMKERMEMVAVLLKKLALQNCILKGKIEGLKEGNVASSITSQIPPTSFRDIMASQRTSKGRNVAPPISGAGRNTIQQRKYSAIIKTMKEDATITGEVIKQNVLKSINPVKEKMKIKNITTLRQGLKIETAGQADLQKILDNKNLKEKGLVVSLSRLRNPRIIVYDIPRELDQEQIVEALHMQNEDALDNWTREEIGNNITFKFRTGRREGECCNWVMEVTAEARNKLRGKERVYIGSRSCKIADFNALSRCYKCQGLGHIAKHCRAAAEVCGHCAEEGHNMKECTKKASERKCALCKKQGRSENHAPDATCPAYKAAVDFQKQNTDYGTT